MKLDSAGWLDEANRVPSPNCDERPRKEAPWLIVIHNISLPPGIFGGHAVEELFTNRLDWDAHPYYRGIRGLKVSAHFLIRRDGELIQFVPCTLGHPNGRGAKSAMTSPSASNWKEPTTSLSPMGNMPD
jgi:N-acetyl-anhydromuramoyl-L-alanine amidase